MLSYQHKYHVGNHADVLKHLCWLSAIDYLNRKDKPYTLFDTHAGEAIYEKNDISRREIDTGIERIVETANDTLLQRYKGLLSEYNDANMLPGSPALASQLMRQQDEMHCIELHPQAARALKRFANQSQANIHCHIRDAFEGLKGLIPPKVKRGAILIDPPYEQISEYKDVKIALKNVIQKWPTAQIMIWLPLLGKRAQEKAKAADKLISTVSGLDMETSLASLTIEDKDNAEGMYGSAVLYVNPHWTFAETLSKTLPVVAKQLGENCEWSVK
jgi:23S rRNA (adenine2030-N6)-methyltransferase